MRIVNRPKRRLACRPAVSVLIGDEPGAVGFRSFGMLRGLLCVLLVGKVNQM